MPVRVVTDTSAGLPEHVARELGITVIMVQRPQLPKVKTVVHTPAEVLQILSDSV